MQTQILKPIHCWLALAVMTLLSGCGANVVNVTAHFDGTRDIKEGASVYFNDQAVGNVADVSFHQSGSVVKIAVREDAVSTISSDAAVVVNRVKPGSPLEIHNPPGEVTQSLQPGQSITAMDSMLELMAWSVGGAIHESSKGVTEFLSGFQEYLASDEFEGNKVEFQQQIQDAGRSAGAALKSIEQDVGKALEEMWQSEQQMADAIDQLGDELSPMFEEISEAGAQLALQLEEFAQRLENATPEQQESGQRLIESMTQMLEKLNNSMERGAERAERQAESAEE